MPLAKMGVTKQKQKERNVRWWEELGGGGLVVGGARED